jgi:hypothetical protein
MVLKPSAETASSYTVARSQDQQDVLTLAETIAISLEICGTLQGWFLS